MAISSLHLTYLQNGDNTHGGNTINQLKHLSCSCNAGNISFGLCLNTINQLKHLSCSCNAGNISFGLCLVQYFPHCTRAGTLTSILAEMAQTLHTLRNIKSNKSSVEHIPRAQPRSSMLLDSSLVCFVYMLVLPVYLLYMHRGCTINIAGREGFCCCSDFALCVF